VISTKFSEKRLGSIIGRLDSSVSIPKESATHREIPELETRVILHDFKEVARQVLSEKAFIYVSSSANSDQRFDEYRKAWSRINFRPRVMRNVSMVDSCSEMLSFKSAYPFFIAPMGLVGTVHQDGELSLACASARRGIHYCISTATSKAFEHIMQTFTSEQMQSRELQSKVFFQLYVNSKPEITKSVLRRIRTLGYAGILITVDTPVIGKRTADRRLQARELLEAGLDTTLGSKPTQESFRGGRGTPGTLSSSLNWTDLTWIREEWPGPIVIKGVQSAADVKLAAQYGVEAVYLSNHGGRQLQDAPSSLDTLLETRKLYPEVFQQCEIFVDGGFMTGADVLKALCLGAKAVGIGRPILYAVAGYGAQGAMKVIDSMPIVQVFTS
jgi:L-lactate dehydrogenase (cytochrome)